MWDIGDIKMMVGPLQPGWLELNGQAVSRTVYNGLFVRIGTRFGAGDGSTTFNVPDMRGRSPIGVGQGSGLTNRTLAEMVGVEYVFLSAAQSGLKSHSHNITQSPHSHTITDPGHNHTITDPGHSHSINVTAASNASLGVDSGANGSENGTSTTSTGIAINTAYSGVTVNSTSIEMSIDDSGDQPASTEHTNMQPSLAVRFVIWTDVLAIPPTS